MPSLPFIYQVKTLLKTSVDLPPEAKETLPIIIPVISDKHITIYNLFFCKKPIEFNFVKLTTPPGLTLSTPFNNAYEGKGQDMTQYLV